MNPEQAVGAPVRHGGHELVGVALRIPAAGVRIRPAVAGGRVGVVEDALHQPRVEEQALDAMPLEDPARVGRLAVDQKALAIDADRRPSRHVGGRLYASGRLAVGRRPRGRAARAPCYVHRRCHCAAPWVARIARRRRPPAKPIQPTDSEEPRCGSAMPTGDTRCTRTVAIPGTSPRTTTPRRFSGGRRPSASTPSRWGSRSSRRPAGRSARSRPSAGGCGRRGCRSAACGPAGP